MTAPHPLSAHNPDLSDANRAGLVAYGATIDAGTGVRIPHETTHVTVGRALVPRAEREAALAATLAPGATAPAGAGTRTIAEDPDPWRTCFEVDLDRIKHNEAFRNLAGKCQVFVAPRNESLRNRLTHAIEVAQVAVAIARRLRLNATLTEAIALAHDCGHGPGGHASEDAFSPYVDGGYDHATWGADVTLAGLNLTVEVLDGVRNHSWRRPAPLTPEAEVVSLADRIAYVCHDFDDAVRAGIVGRGDLPEDVADVVGRSQGAQLGVFIDSVCGAAERSGRIGLLAGTADALDAYRRFNYERIYLRPASAEQSRRVIRLLREIVDHYTDAPGLLSPGDHAPSGSAEAARAAVAHVASLTDRAVLNLGTEVLGWERRDLPRAV